MSFCEARFAKPTFFCLHTALRSIMCVSVCVCAEWATEEVLLYTTLEGLRCNSVLRLDLTPTGARITSVLQETQPE